MWKRLKLDVLVLTCYAPGHSTFYPIEHCWAPLSKERTGETLLISLCEDIPSPWVENGLSDKETLKQKGEILNDATETCKKYWNNKRYDSFHIKVVSVPCEGDTPLERNHELVISISSASPLKIQRRSIRYQEGVSVFGKALL